MSEMAIGFYVEASADVVKAADVCPTEGCTLRTGHDDGIHA